jgi:hypothetical protein
MVAPETPPPKIEGCSLSYPAPWILLVTIQRERQMNSIPSKLHWQMDAVFNWFDKEPTLRVAVITGAGKKAFCAGQDLIELGKRDRKTAEEEPWLGKHPHGGFAGISRRLGKKPIVAAVNGFALGGGFEITLNWYAFFLMHDMLALRRPSLTCIAATAWLHPLQLDLAYLRLFVAFMLELAASPV